LCAVRSEQHPHMSFTLAFGTLRLADFSIGYQRVSLRG